MKRLTVIFFILFSFQYAFAQKSADIKYASLTVTMVGFRNSKGVVRIGLYNSRDNYEGKGNPFRGLVIKIKNNKATALFENIPFGVYAIKLYHDENSNGLLDKNFMGIPTEEYGFSNNAGGMFGPADYDDAKFKINKDSLKIEIKIE